MIKNLKSMRLARGISQRNLAKEIGVSQQSINKYENHETEPDIEILKKLADFFNTSIDYLVGYTDIQNKIEKTYQFDVNEQEMQLINDFRHLNHAKQKSITDIMKNYLN